MPNGTAIKRSTEGSRPGKRGRPPGSRNKPKALLGRDLAAKLLKHMQDQLSPANYEYLVGVVKDGKPIETKNEIDTLIALVTRNLYPAILMEMLPPEEGGLGGQYRKDVTDRLKLVRELLTLRNDIDKRESPDDDGTQPLLTITARRGLDVGRLGILIGQRTDSVGGSPDGTGRSADEVRALPDKLSERQIVISDSEQGETDRVLDSSEYRDITPSSDEPRLQK